MFVAKQAANPENRGLKTHKLKKLQSFGQDAVKAAQESKILQLETPGFLEPENELEKTYKITQKELEKAVDLVTSEKKFDFELTEFGPYAFDYSRNGQHVLLGGAKGHIASFDWRKKKLLAEIHVRETVRDVKWLYNEQMFAAAQKKYVYIYDKEGLELHRLHHHVEVNAMQFLPYHFLLASLGNAGFLKYQDISTGQVVSEIKTKAYSSSCLAQNRFNAVLHVGNNKGVVSLWAPSMSEPLVQMFCHRGPIKSIAIDRSGNYMATSGIDSQLKIWDIRKFQEVHEYFVYNRPYCLDISDTGILAVGAGPHLTLWKDALKTKQKMPYMSHLEAGSQIRTSKFCAYEDIIGISFQTGFKTLLVPGAGEPNFDTFEVNPFETKKQRQENEVRALLEKLKPETISLDPDFLGQIRLKPNKVEDDSKKSFILNPTVKAKNSRLRKIYRRKSKNIIDYNKVRLEKAIQKEKTMRRLKNFQDRNDQVKEKYGVALARLAMKPKY